MFWYAISEHETEIVDADEVMRRLPWCTSPMLYWGYKHYSHFGTLDRLPPQGDYGRIIYVKQIDSHVLCIYDKKGVRRGFVDNVMLMHSSQDPGVLIEMMLTSIGKNPVDKEDGLWTQEQY